MSTFEQEQPEVGDSQSPAAEWLHEMTRKVPAVSTIQVFDANVTSLLVESPKFYCTPQTTRSIFCVCFFTSFLNVLLVRQHGLAFCSNIIFAINKLEGQYDRNNKAGIHSST